MNFRDLEYIISVGEHLSFSLAAEHCNVSQPSLSAQIKKVEDELNTPLFIRNKRNVSVTTFGAAFIKKARDILSAQEEIKRLARASQDPIEGDLALGAILTIAPYMFPAIMRDMRESEPQIHLLLREAKTDTLLKLILNGEIDAAIVSLPTDQYAFESRILFRDLFYLAVPPGHRLADHKTISEDDLDGEKLLLLEEGHCFRSQALSLCYSASISENRAFTSTSLETIRHLVATGEGITLMPEMACHKNDGLKYIPMDDRKFGRDVGLIWRQSSDKKSQIEKLLSILKK